MSARCLNLVLSTKLGWDITYNLPVFCESIFMLKKIRSLFGSDTLELPARALYHRIVEQARQRFLYEEFDVPDTANGRFDMIVLHCYCVMRRLKQTPEGFKLSQMLATILIDDLDRNLREMGVGDLSVGKKVKRIAEGFYGRLDAYDVATLNAETESLSRALERNVYFDLEVKPEKGVEGLTDYFQKQIDNIDGTTIDRLSKGFIDFYSP